MSPAPARLASLSAALAVAAFLGGAPAAAQDFLAPQSGRITAAYAGPHRGLDIAGADASAVTAARAGRIVSYGPAGPAGNVMVVAHEAGYATHYARLAAPARPVGAQVRAGETIALQGTTGLESGAHVHFEVRRFGTKQALPGAVRDFTIRGRPLLRDYPEIGRAPALPADAAAARDLVRAVAIPRLEASFAWRNAAGDDLARLRAARRGLDLAVAALSLPRPPRGPAAVLLRRVTIPALESSPGYARTRRENPNVFARTEIGISREAMLAAVARLGGAPGSAPAAAARPDVATALRELRNVAIPELERSTAYAFAGGDNLARMAIVRGGLDLAVDLLSFAAPEPVLAADHLGGIIIPVLEASPGYRRIVARNPNAFAQTHVGKARRAIGAAIAALTAAAGPAPAPAPPPPAAHWSRAGVFVWHATAFSPHIHGDLMVQHRLGWVAVMVHDGLTVEAPNEAAFASGWIATLRRRGIMVGAWGVNRTDPEREAALASQLVRRWGFDFYIANAEMEYKYTQGSGAFSPEAYGRSQRFVAAFRALEPSIATGVSSYGRADMADIDWAAWRRGGFVWLPQAYWNEHAIYEPAACVDGAVAAGWPRSHVFPTIGIWGGGQRAYVSAAEYAARLQVARTVGFSVYLGESMDLGEWPSLGAAVAAGLAR